MQRHVPAGKSTKVFALALCAVASGGGRSAAQQPSSRDDPARLAAAIAHTMSVTRPSTAANAPIVQQFSSHGNVVESRTTFKDANGFANATARRGDIQAQTTRYMCQADRRSYVRKGVVFDEVFVGPDPAKPFSFLIDERVCASLAAPVLADPAELRRLVDATAKRLDAALAGKSSFPGSHFGALTVKGDTIEVTNLIDAPAFVDFFKLKDFEVRGKTQGVFCSILGDPIRRGVKIRMIFEIENGPPVLDVPIDSSVC